VLRAGLADVEARWAFGQYPAMVNEEIFLAGLKKLER